MENIWVSEASKNMCFPTLAWTDFRWLGAKTALNSVRKTMSE